MSRVIELVHTIFIDRSFYIFSINDFGTKEKILIFPFEMKFPVIWTSIAACSVQVGASLLLSNSGKQE